MRISALSAATNVPVATIKYYLREGLVPAGHLTSSTQAQYDETHVERLRLVRALLGPAGLTIAQARRVLAAIDEPATDTLGRLAQAQHATTKDAEATDTAAAERLVAQAGWQVDPSSPELAQLAAALAAIDHARFEIPEPSLEVYLRTMAEIAEAEIEGIPTDSDEAAIRYSVLGTILVEPLLLALRRLAQQDASIRRFGGGIG
ncbi:MAG: MerR family transcriptional regulator [Microbacterium sp.]